MYGNMVFPTFFIFKAAANYLQIPLFSFPPLPFAAAAATDGSWSLARGNVVRTWKTDPEPENKLLVN